MTRTAYFTVTGTPKGQPRPRVTRFGTYNGHSADEWKAAVRAAWAESGCQPFPRHLRMRLEFWMARPAGHLTKRGAFTKSAPAHHTHKPDADNLAKAVLDALQDAGAYPDDSRIISLHVSKAWAEQGGCRITITEGD